MPVAQERFGADLGPYISNWSVLLALNSGTDSVLKKSLSKLNVHVEQLMSFVSVLARVEEGDVPDAIIIDKRLITAEARELLRAMLKLCPSAAVVVLCENPKEDPEQLEADIVFLSSRVSTENILFGMVEARSLAMKRN